MIPKIVSHFRQKKPIIELGNLDVSRDYSDVRFVAQAYHRLLRSGPRGEAVNICSDTTISLMEIIHQCEQLGGYTIEVRQHPDFMRTNEVRMLRGDAGKLRALSEPGEETIPFTETLHWMLLGERNE